MPMATNARFRLRIPLREMGRGGAEGFINGHRVPVAGRVTMISPFSMSRMFRNAKSAPVTISSCFGPNVPVDDVARAAGTIGYEMLTSLGLRYERQYLIGDE